MIEARTWFDSAGRPVTLHGKVVIVDGDPYWQPATTTRADPALVWVLLETGVVCRYDEDRDRRGPYLAEIATYLVDVPASIRPAIEAALVR